jgi:anti-sigma regulatory factor (Ser/Thr protein kinase)
MASASTSPESRDGLIIVENPPVKNPSGPAELKLNCPARITALHAALDAIEQACDTWKIDISLVSRARIAVEELFSNTVKYGYGEECERPVRLHLRPNPELTLTYEDEAPSFNPLTLEAGRYEGFAPEEPPIGQAGIAMVIGLAAHVDYQRRAGANCLTITFARKR